MKGLLILIMNILVVTVFVTTCKNEQQNKKIELLNYSGSLKMYNKDLGGVFDSIKIVNGSGSYEVTDDKGLVVNMYLTDIDHHNAHYAILEKGTIEVYVTKDSSIVFGGTPNNILLGELNMKKEPLRVQLHPYLHVDYSNLSKEDSTALRSMNNQIVRDLGRQIVTYEKEFALNNDNLAGLVYVRRRMSTFSMPELEQLTERYKQFENHPVYKTLKRYYGAAVKTRVGAKASNFSLPNPKGKQISLSDKKGKVILLDFWASWCIPCRKAIPHLKELNDRFKSNGLEIVSVSIDKDRDKWLEAVSEEKMPWDQLHDDKKRVASDYYITAIPRIFIIDKNGVIIAKDLRDEALTLKLEEVFSQTK
ncbi:AhpC/TSA family protein [Flavobacteriaceae bacterium F08102]|nr:AhpC/TSA family protein [Flavobacteriaceae bacterium F08102]